MVEQVRIHGAGPVGLMLALYLRRAGWSENQIELIDPAIAKQASSHENDPRVLALSHGTLLRLSQLGITHDATEIKQIHVSAEGHFGMMEIRNERVGVTQLGALLGYASLLSSMRKRAAELGLIIHPEVRAAHGAQVTVIAEGGIFQAHDMADAAHLANPPKTRDYHQTAVIGWVRTAAPAADTAYERFTDDGAVALLPVADRYALIWCCSHARAASFQKAPMQQQAQEIGAVMRGRIAAISSVQITGAYPLGMKWRDQIVQGSQVWIGNSAQTLHPIAGQGMNLGFRDAEALATCLSQHGQSIETRLADYAKKRAIDRWAVRTATDTLARQGWVRKAIGAVGLVPGAKRLLGQVLMYGG